MNPKIVIWSTLALLILAPSSWFSWSFYQRQENTKILNSVAAIVAEPSNAMPENLEALQAKIKEIDIAISLMQQIPSNTADIYLTAQTNLSKLKSRHQRLSQRLEIEQKVIQDIDKAESFAIAAVKIGAQPRNTSKQWNEAYANWQEAIGILQRIPKSNFADATVQKKLAQYKESASIVNSKVSSENKVIDLLTRAKDLANQAVSIAKNPPHSSDTWALAYGKWQDAIELLEKIPPNTSVTAESKRLLSEYQKNRGIILNEFRKRELLETQYKQENEFELFFVSLSSDTKDSLRRLKAYGYGRARFTSLCFQIITDNTTSADLAERGFELNSYANGICNYVWDRL